MSECFDRLVKFERGTIMNNTFVTEIIGKIILYFRFRIIVFFTLFFLLTGCTKKETTQSPNIVFILVDDMGTEVLECYGGTTYHTPNINKLALNGMQFNHCFSSPVCSPSRQNLLTGRYGFRTGQDWGHLPKDERTFGHILQDAGYKTAIAGKWQMALLKDNPDHIAESGFDESCVFGWHEGPRYYEPMIYQNGKVRDDVKDEYGPDVYLNFLIDFIKENTNRKFLAYYSMALVHEISNDLPAPPPKGPTGNYQSYKELVEYADVLIGRLMEALTKQRLLENTVIIFTTDNGTPYHFITKYENGKYIREPVYSEIEGSLVRGGKGFMTNAGTHVPLVVNWKGVTKPGSINNSLIDFSDFLPTFVDLAGAEIPDDRIIDGKSFLPSLFNKNKNIRDWVYVEWADKSWIRNQNWKLYNNGSLFDMRHDFAEKRPFMQSDDTKESLRMRKYFKTELQQLINK
jgi:arylsulfatase A